MVDGDSDFTPAKPVIEYNLTFKTAPLAGETNINGKDPLFVDRGRSGISACARAARPSGRARAA